MRLHERKNARGERNHRWCYSDSAKVPFRGRLRRLSSALIQSRMGAATALAITETIIFAIKIIFDWCQALAGVLADRQKWHVDDVQPTCEVPDKPEMKIQAIFAIYLV